MARTPCSPPTPSSWRAGTRAPMTESPTIRPVPHHPGSTVSSPTPLDAPAALSFQAYCGDLFRELARSDQRRWGEVYLRGLLSVPGRKTPTRISEHVLG